MNKKNHIKLVNNLQATIGRTQKTTFELSTSHLKGKRPFIVGDLLMGITPFKYLMFLSTQGLVREN